MSDDDHIIQKWVNETPPAKSLQEGRYLAGANYLDRSTGVSFAGTTAIRFGRVILVDPNMLDIGDAPVSKISIEGWTIISHPNLLILRSLAHTVGAFERKPALWQKQFKKNLTDEERHFFPKLDHHDPVVNSLRIQNSFKYFNKYTHVIIERKNPLPDETQWSIKEWYTSADDAMHDFMKTNNPHIQIQEIGG